MYWRDLKLIKQSSPTPVSRGLPHSPSLSRQQPRTDTLLPNLQWPQYTPCHSKQAGPSKLYRHKPTKMYTPKTPPMTSSGLD